MERRRSKKVWVLEVCQVAWTCSPNYLEVAADLGALARVRMLFIG